MFSFAKNLLFRTNHCNRKSVSNRKSSDQSPTETLKMSFPSSLCLLIAFTVSTNGQNEVRRPPTITKGPERNVIFRGTQAVTLTCRAEGIPAVSYEWRKNGDLLSLNNVDFSGISDGDITIRAATENDEGFYQCFAKNMYGKALSTVAHLQRAFLGPSSPSDIVNHTVQEGHPFIIPAARRTSYPTPTYDWDVVQSSIDPDPRKYQQSQRVRSACNGDLYFAYAIKSEDELNGRIYMSTVFNANIDVRSGGSYTRVIVTTGPNPDFRPNITYFSKSQEVALIGGWIELKCFFSGKPAPTIAWSRPRSNLPSRPRSSISHFRTTLNISNIVDSDGGDYVCTATNANGTANHVHNIRVEAVPIFKQESDGPQDVNVTEGDSITFNCSAFAIPDSTVVWFQNGDPLDAKDAPKRFAFSSDMKSLTIRDVCRDCDNRESKTDLMVIQCNASNVHGYAFASGYLNVLLRTKVTLQQSSTFVSVDLTKENRFQFDCSATSDPSTPVTVQWYKVLDQGRRELVYNELPYLSVMNGNLTLYTDANCSDTCHKYLGEYICVADNKYTQDNVTVRLNSTTESATNVLPVSMPGGLTIQDFWVWIIIATANLVLLLLVFSVCTTIIQCKQKARNNVASSKEENNRPEDLPADFIEPDYETIDDDFMKSAQNSQPSLTSGSFGKGSKRDVQPRSDTYVSVGGVASSGMPAVKVLRQTVRNESIVMGRAREELSDIPEASESSVQTTEYLALAKREPAIQTEYDVLKEKEELNPVLYMSSKNPERVKRIKSWFV